MSKTLYSFIAYLVVFDCEVVTCPFQVTNLTETAHTHTHTHTHTHSSCTSIYISRPTCHSE